MGNLTIYGKPLHHVSFVPSSYHAHTNFRPALIIIPITRALKKNSFFESD
jgi:hypothetical protein